MREQKHKMKKTTCFEINDLAFQIKLEQTGVDSFTVTYGKHVTPKLSYGSAATELGASIMHALACEQKLDNRHAGQRG